MLKFKNLCWKELRLQHHVPQLSSLDIQANAIVRLGLLKLLLFHISDICFIAADLLIIQDD